MVAITSTSCNYGFISADLKIGEAIYQIYVRSIDHCPAVILYKFTSVIEALAKAFSFWVRTQTMLLKTSSPVK